LSSKKQIKNVGVLFIGQLLIKGSSFIKQLLLAFFLGVSGQVDLLIVSQIIPSLLSSMIAGGAGEILVTNQKKGKKYDEEFVVLFIFTIATLTILTGVIYLLCLPLVSSLFDVQISKKSLFWSISIIVILARIPAAFVSGLQHLLFAKDKYNFFIISSLVAEISGILTIILLFKSAGVLAFAYGLFVTPLVNALFFVYAHKLNVFVIFKKEVWKTQKEELVSILKKTFSLGLQTLLNQLSTFWERTLSFRYLSEGFLSAMNYSKSLTELPKMALLSSILTTTYIEQVNKKTEDEGEYLKYTNKMEKFLSEISLIFQTLSILFGPFILILFFKRGAFDELAVAKTFSIYQVLSIGFLPGLMLNFLSRTMYIESEFKKLFYVILTKFLIEIGIMVGFIGISSYAIPTALVLGKFFGSIMIFIILVRKHKEIFNIPAFIKINVLLILISGAIGIANNYIINLLLPKSIWELIAIYTPIIIISVIAIFYYLNRNYGVEFKKYFLKKSV
jgi:putative peptidoglycan lipid II flippase